MVNLLLLFPSDTLIWNFWCLLHLVEWSLIPWLQNLGFLPFINARDFSTTVCYPEAICKCTFFLKKKFVWHLILHYIIKAYNLKILVAYSLFDLNYHAKIPLTYLYYKHHLMVYLRPKHWKSSVFLFFV